MSQDLSGMVGLANSLAGVDESGQPTTEVSVQPTSNILPDAEAEKKRLEAVKLLEEEEGKQTSTSLENNKETEVKETPEQTVERLQKELEELKKAKEEPTVDPLKIVEETATKAGIDILALEKTYVEAGHLTKEQLESLSKAGFDEVAINAYITMRESKIIESENVLLNKIGLSGRDEYVEMAKWMAENLSKEECATYDKGMESESLREFFLKTYFDKYSATKQPVQTQQVQPVTFRGSTVQTSNPTSTSFTNIEEVSIAMADPRYKNDYKYRNEVLTKLQRSNY